MGQSESRSIIVAVSEPMRRLRTSQTRLNAMLWSTEICYGHVLGSDLDPESDVWSLFAHARSQAWFPNNEGSIKYSKTIPAFLEDVQANQTFLHRHVMINFYTQFEAYLKERLGVWNGPFVRTLAGHARLASAYAPQGETVLLADLSRLLRNKLVHQESDMPRRAHDAATTRMCETFEFKSNPSERLAMHAALARWSLTFEQVDRLVRKFIGGVDGKCRKSATQGNILTHEFFYALFTFTHLDNLAFEIEEALFDPAEATARISRAAHRVRHPDMEGVAKQI